MLSTQLLALLSAALPPLGTPPCGSWQTSCVCGDFVSVGPCGNDTVGEGCFNSTGVGAVLTAAGCFRVSSDDVVLTVSQLPPNQFGIVFSSPTPSFAQAAFGDGILCLDPPHRRYGIHSTGPGGSFTEGPGIAAYAGVLPGDTLHVQAWYRDPAGPCGSGFNLSSAIQTDWVL